MGFKKSRALPLSLALFAILLQLAANFVRADEIVISGNGSESSNEVIIQSSQTTTVTQENNADISSNVEMSSNTGGNTIENNTGGGVGVVTGDAIENLEIENSVNSSSVEGPCCPSDISAEISGNGEESTNNIAIENQAAINISISQTANVENNVQGTANTGENKANDNTGSGVLIDTGNIWVTGGLHNGPIDGGGITWGCWLPPGDGDGDGGPPPPPPPPGDDDGDGNGNGDGDGSSAGAAGAGGYVLALAETSGE